MAALFCLVVAAAFVDWRLGLVALGGALTVAWWLLEPIDGGES